MANYLFRTRQHLKGGYIGAYGGWFTSLRQCADHCLACGDGHYTAEWQSAENLVGEPVNVSSWGYESLEICVHGGKLTVREQSAEDRLIGVSRRLPRPINHVTLYVVRAGNLTSEGSLRDVGICVVKSPRPGDELIDVLGVEADWNTEAGRYDLVVCSDRQRESYRGYRFTPDGKVQWEPDRKHQTFDLISLSGRAAGWGTIGDDTYDEDSAEWIVAQIFRESLLGCEWRVSRIYWDASEQPSDDAAMEKFGKDKMRDWRHGEVLRIPLALSQEEIENLSWLGTFAGLLERRECLLEPFVEPA